MFCLYKINLFEQAAIFKITIVWTVSHLEIVLFVLVFVFHFDVPVALLSVASVPESISQVQ